MPYPRLCTELSTVIVDSFVLGRACGIADSTVQFTIVAKFQPTPQGSPAKERSLSFHRPMSSTAPFTRHDAA